ncbi:MAG: glycosyltransferase family 2 protein [Cocleimonas sp.]|nr:glycosyltransferase family 2 protein [Cocleimonas sp.]
MLKIKGLYRETVLEGKATLIPTLSIVYITLNAAQYLEESLAQSKQLSQDILVVDSGSDDETLTLVQEAEVRLIHQDWLGFSGQKQFAINQAKYDWVLFLDADEVLSSTAIVEIQACFDVPHQAVAYSLPRENWFQGKWIRYGSWWPDRVVRLVDRTQGAIKAVKVHESWETDSTVQVIALNGVIKHYSYQSYSELIQKADRYSTLAAEQLYEKGKTCGSGAPLLHAMASFIRLLILKQGFRDGLEGTAIAYTAALASFMKYAKLRELHCQADNKNVVPK